MKQSEQVFYPNTENKSSQHVSLAARPEMARPPARWRFQVLLFGLLLASVSFAGGGGGGCPQQVANAPGHCSTASGFLNHVAANWRTNWGPACRCAVFCLHLHRHNPNYSNPYCNPAIHMIICNDTCVTVWCNQTSTWNNYWNSGNLPSSAIAIHSINHWALQGGQQCNC